MPTSTAVVFTDPAVVGTLSLAQLNANFTWLLAQINQIQHANPDLTSYVASFQASPDGTMLQVLLNGVVVETIPLPAQAAAFQGPYTPGKSYVVYQEFSYQGSTYAVTTPFTATNFAGDAANYTVLMQGVVLPVPSTSVQDVTNNQTLDKTIAGLAKSLATINASIVTLQTQANKNTANIAAINAKLGNDSVTGFPLTLQ